jgi:DNA gyrase/topoisomerase IV subunit A
MATNIPPHNLREVVDATAYLIDNKDATTEDLMQFVQGPDFPLGGVIFNSKDILHAYSGSSIKRIQYAIRMGILPRPEVFGQLLNNKRITKK